MTFLNRVANGLGTLIGVLKDTTAQVIAAVKSSYDAYRNRGGATQDVAREAAEKKKDRLREVNDEIMDLRNRRMSRGNLSDAERRRWESLREERDELIKETSQSREVEAAEKIIESEDSIKKFEVDVESTHVLQYNAFADTLGKRCVCGRSMKLQWQRNLAVVKPKDFFWGCTGWYIQQGARKACAKTEPLSTDDYGLMMDTTQLEFSLTSEEFRIILTDPKIEAHISQRIDDLKSDLTKSNKGVDMVTCPVHGENMVMRSKDGASGLLDEYFLACPYWLPRDKGCPFMDKLKSGSQLAALLKSQTGRGIL